ncbi:MAG: hypothetical protein KKF01_10725, partial [Proteobacteria bacterium]|nr:hypothetical protein [Pseudomonadota bacterium]
GKFLTIFHGPVKKYSGRIFHTAGFFILTQMALATIYLREKAYSFDIIVTCGRLTRDSPFSSNRSATARPTHWKALLVLEALPVRSIPRGASC